jgi:hypothetical protein
VAGFARDGSGLAFSADRKIRRISEGSKLVMVRAGFLPLSQSFAPAMLMLPGASNIFI